MSVYNNPKPFRYWCQKVLPLVYDDSLSYYELLSRVVDYINNLTNDNKTVIADLERLANYVNNYFATMDVTEEVNAALDRMAEDGSLDKAIGYYVNPVMEQQQAFNIETRALLSARLTAQDNTIESLRSQIGTPLVAMSSAGMTDTSRIYVFVGTEAGYTTGNWYYYNGSAWVSGGVYNSQGIETDKTLSIVNSAADAGSTGTLKAAVEDAGYPFFTLETGGIYQETGIEFVDPDRTRSGFIPVKPGQIVVITNNSSAAGVGVWEFAYNTTTTEEVNPSLNFTSLTNRRNVYIPGDDCYYIRLMVIEHVNDVTGKLDVHIPKNPVITPSMFDTGSSSDQEMVQAAFNYAFSHKCNVAFDRMYYLQSGEYITLNKYPSVNSERFPTYVYGMTGNDRSCGITKVTSGYVFIPNDSYAFSGDFTFENLTFVSQTNADTTVFDMNRLMRLTVKSCTFLNVDCVAKNYAHAALPSSRDHYWQSVAFRDCTVLGGSGYAFIGTGCYDVVFDHVLIEHRDGGIYFVKDSSYTGNPYYMSCRNLRINNCCIEGLSGKYITGVIDGTPAGGCAVKITNPLSVSITGCYFEQNYKNIVLATNDPAYVYNALISGCWLSGLFYENRYGTLTVYEDHFDDTCLVTIENNNIRTLIQGCSSERGGIVRTIEDDTQKTVYISNSLQEDAKGKYSYQSYTFDAGNETWTGNNPQEVDEITSVNINEEYCLTPVYERMV